MTAAIADILPPGPAADVHLDPEPDAALLALYRYRGQDLPPIARTLLMSAPWQAFGSIRRDGRTVAVGRVSVAGRPWGALTAVQVDAACQRQGLGAAITTGLAAAAAAAGARDILLQVETAQHAGPRAVRPLRFPATRTATITCGARPLAYATRGSGCLGPAAVSRYVCHYGDPCPQRIWPLARRAG